VVARAGLGGGKGAGEAEHDNAETVSSKPMNNYIESFVNSLSRRYHGANRMVTFNLKDDEGAEDEVEMSKASQTYVSFGGKTLNDARAEQGLPLYDMPEADEPMIITSTGPVFLKGTLDTQLNPTPPPPPIIMQGSPDGSQSSQNAQGEEGSQGPQPQSEGSESGGKEKEAGLKAAEVESYKNYSRKPRNREFEWRFHTPEEAEIVKAGLAPRPKSLLTKKKAEDYDSNQKLTELAKKHAKLIGSAIIAGMSGVDKAVSSALSQVVTVGEPHYSAVATFAVAQNVTFDSTQAVTALGNLYTSASELAVKDATSHGIPTVASKSVDQLLANRGIVLKGISDSSMKRISDAIANGIANGEGHRTIADAVQAIIADPARSDVISITEASRSFNSTFIDQLQAAGESQFEWIAEQDACDECAELEGLHDISDPVPPEHPNCRCRPVMVGVDQQVAA
jgi:SPP1 gp7 family putative phage head morphogenesis protein